MANDFQSAEQERALAVLLHPHPDYGGTRLHPFVDGLFRRLPGIGVSSLRFDFTSSQPELARAETLDAIFGAIGDQRDTPVLMVGYSFGAGIATTVADDRVAAWYLLAPQTPFLDQSPIGQDPRPKILAVPEHDQFSPPDAVAVAVAGWNTCEVVTLPGIDHFLGPVGPIVQSALEWIDATARPPSGAALQAT